MRIISPPPFATKREHPGSDDDDSVRIVSPPPPPLRPHLPAKRQRESSIADDDDDDDDDASVRIVSPPSPPTAAAASSPPAKRLRSHTAAAAAAAAAAASDEKPPATPDVGPSSLPFLSSPASPTSASSPAPVQRRPRGRRARALTTATSAGDRAIKTEDGELLCWPARMPPYIVQLPDLSLKQLFPPTNDKFSRAFLSRWLGGSPQETHVHVGRDKRCTQLYDVADYDCWAPDWNPHIPPRRGVHGACLSVDVWRQGQPQLRRRRRQQIAAQNPEADNGVDGGDGAHNGSDGGGDDGDDDGYGDGGVGGGGGDVEYDGDGDGEAAAQRRYLQEPRHTFCKRRPCEYE